MYYSKTQFANLRMKLDPFLKYILIHFIFLQRVISYAKLDPHKELIPQKCCGLFRRLPIAYTERSTQVVINIGACG